MNKYWPSLAWINLGSSGGNFISGLAAGLLVSALAGCGGGSGGDAGSAQAQAAPTSVGRGAGPLAAASALNFSISSVAISSPPVVDFTVTDQNGVGMNGLTAADLRFNIAKLAPGSNGIQSVWQNYFNVAVNGAIQGSQERAVGGFALGTLANGGNGSYRYTFATDITNPAANPCPAPCTDVNGKALDISYQPGLTHRVTIEQSNPAYPKSTGVYDFVPNGSFGSQRNIVATASCDQCHDVLVAHGSPADTRLCATCHNPGTWVAGTPGTSLDFKVIIHRIHYNNDGAALPSVLAGTPNMIGSVDFSRVVFPQDVRNCTKCHSAAPGAANATPQGDNWKTQPNLGACSSCHDDVYFGTKPDPAKPYQTKPHPGGVWTDDAACALCHEAGRSTEPKDIVIAHSYPDRLKAATAKFQYNILSVGPTTAGTKPVITFSVTDPTNGGAPYDIKTATAFTAGAASRLVIDIGWTTVDFTNSGSGANYGQPISINVLGNAAVVAGSAAGTYTVTSPVAIPAAQTGTLRVAIEGHPAGDVSNTGVFTDPLPVPSVFKDLVISGTLTARRTVVDVTKCDVCHNVLSVHGKNRDDNTGVCALCHNPNATDAATRPAVAGVLTGGIDGKLEQSIDFKILIHAIHAGESGKGGIRTKGIVVYGADRIHDYSNQVMFPGRLKNCTTCHLDATYQLVGIWDIPTANGIQGTSISTGASASDPADNLRITPTAAVCSACHDGAAAKLHMADAFSGAQFSATQAAINAAAPENCSFCHGSGRAIDVKTVHGVN